MSFKEFMNDELTSNVPQIWSRERHKSSAGNAKRRERFGVLGINEKIKIKPFLTK
jgi:hypothetical protein